MGKDDKQREATTDPAATTAEPDADEKDTKDTEGHYLFHAEAARLAAGDKSREADHWARAEKLRREAKKGADKKR